MTVFNQVGLYWDHVTPLNDLLAQHPQARIYKQSRIGSSSYGYYRVLLETSPNQYCVLGFGDDGWNYSGDMSINPVGEATPELQSTATVLLSVASDALGIMMRAYDDYRVSDEVKQCMTDLMNIRLHIPVAKAPDYDHEYTLDELIKLYDDGHALIRATDKAIEESLGTVDKNVLGDNVCFVTTPWSIKPVDKKGVTELFIDYLDNEGETRRDESGEPFSVLRIDNYAILKYDITKWDDSESRDYPTLILPLRLRYETDDFVLQELSQRFIHEHLNGDYKPTVQSIGLPTSILKPRGMMEGINWIDTPPVWNSGFSKPGIVVDSKFNHDEFDANLDDVMKL